MLKQTAIQPSVHSINWSVSLWDGRKPLPNKEVEKNLMTNTKHEGVTFDVTFGSFPKRLYAVTQHGGFRLPALECEVSLACLAVVPHSLLNKQH